MKARELSLTVLLKLLADPERSVRIAAEKSLVAFGAAASDSPLGGDRRAGEAERALVAALAQADPDERRLIIAAGVKNGLQAVLRQGIGDMDETVRLDAVRAAGALVPPALDLVSSAVHDRSDAVRAEAIRLLAVSSASAKSGAREILPIFETMLRGGDPAARAAAVIAIGDLTGAGAAAARLLGEVLDQRSESVRASAARALARLAEREPDAALPYLERALRDASYDVRSAAIPGLALAWAGKKEPAELAKILESSEADSPRRFVALEALVIDARAGKHKKAAEEALARVAEKGPPLARLAAQIGRSFPGAKTPEMHAFLERLLGG